MKGKILICLDVRSSATFLLEFLLTWVQHPPALYTPFAFEAYKEP
jgi:hypothetical protein